MEAMYNDGLAAAVFIGIFGLLLPALWAGWWLIADAGERVSGTPHRTHYETRGSRLRSVP